MPNVKAAYDKFAAKNAIFDQNNMTMFEAMPLLRAYVKDCSNDAIGKLDTDDLDILYAIANYAFAKEYVFQETPEEVAALRCLSISGGVSHVAALAIGQGVLPPGVGALWRGRQCQGA
jgi:hypothetical protein